MIKLNSFWNHYYALCMLGKCQVSINQQSYFTAEKESEWIHSIYRTQKKKCCSLAQATTIPTVAEAIFVLCSHSMGHASSILVIWNQNMMLWLEHFLWSSVSLAWLILLIYFCYYSWILLHFLVPFMSLTILFQLTFTFIYGTFSKKNFNFSKINGFQTDP